MCRARGHGLPAAPGGRLSRGERSRDHAHVQKFYGVPLSREIGLKIPQMYDAAAGGQTQGALAHGRGPRADRPEHRTRQAGPERAGIPGRAGAVHDTDGRVRQCRAARLLLLREERHFYQRRAPRPARQRGDPAAGGHQIRWTDHRGHHEAHGLPAAGLHARRRARGNCASGTVLQGGDVGRPGRQRQAVAHPGGRVRTKILHKETFKRGLGKFHFFEFKESREIVQNRDEFPFILTTGRILEHYNCRHHDTPHWQRFDRRSR